MRDFEIPFDKSKAIGAVLFGLGIFFFGVWLFLGKDTIELPYKYQSIFRSTANASYFMLVSGAGFSAVGMRRFLTSRAGIVLNADGFMDHRYLKSPIPWYDILYFDTRYERIWRTDVEVLLLQIRPGSKSKIRFNLNYMFNNFIKSTHEEVIAFTLNDVEDQDSYDFKQAFTYWINNGKTSLARPNHNSARPQGFGRRVGH